MASEGFLALVNFAWESEPGYPGNSALAWPLPMGVAKLLPRAMASTLMAFLQKRSEGRV